VDILDTIAAQWPLLATTASAVIVVVKYAPLAWKAGRQMYQLVKALEAIAMLPAKVDALSAQVLPNGGSSLRDAIDRIGGRVDELDVVIRTRWHMDPHIASFRNDENGACTAANLKLCQLFGAPESEITGMNWRNFVHPSDMDRMTREWLEAVKMGADFTMRVKYQDSKGVPIPALCTAKAVRVGGKIYGWIGIVEPEAK
jgi:PAS domain S-box-containing protein